MALKKNLLIVGGTGFIGNHLIKYYSNKYKITSISKKNSTISEKVINFDHINCDLENSEQAKNFFSGNNFNFIINCGGYVDHKDFLSDGHKVKIRLWFKGREIVHKQLGEQLVEKIVESVSESGELDNEPKFEGKNLTMMVLPKKIKAVKKSNGNAKDEIQ